MYFRMCGSIPDLYPQNASSKAFFLQVMTVENVSGIAKCSPGGQSHTFTLRATHLVYFLVIRVNRNYTFIVRGDSDLLDHFFIYQMCVFVYIYLYSCNNLFYEIFLRIPVS